MPTTTWTTAPDPVSVSVATSVTTATVIGATQILDSFSGAVQGSDLDTHTGEIGSRWTRIIDTAEPAVISSLGRVYHSSGVIGTLYYVPTAPLSADYRVSADVARLSTQPSGVMDILARCSSVVGGDRYGARYNLDNAATPRWELYKLVGGVGTTLSVFTDTIPVGTTRSVALDIAGSRLTVYIDGVQQIAVTDAAISIAGFAGLSAATLNTSTAHSSDTQGLHLDNFLVKALDSVSTTTTVIRTATPLPPWTTQSDASAQWGLSSVVSTTWSPLA